jgi:hypothetical protein
MYTIRDSCYSCLKTAWFGQRAQRNACFKKRQLFEEKCVSLTVKGHRLEVLTAGFYESISPGPSFIGSLAPSRFFKIAKVFTIKD